MAARSFILAFALLVCGGQALAGPLQDDLKARRARLMERNGLSAEQADQRIAAQLSNDERAGRAQLVIDNSGTIEDLERRVDEAWATVGTPAAGRGA